MRPPPPSRCARTLALFLACGLLCTAADSAHAREYSTYIEVIDSDDLRELYYEGVIEDDEFEILLNLIENPLDLNRAGGEDVFQLPGVSAQLAQEIVEERILNGPYALLPDLVNRVQDVTWRLVETMRPFVQVRAVEGAAKPLSGTMGLITFKEFRAVQPIENDYPARSHSPNQLGYEKWPNTAIGAHARVMGFLDLGFIGFAQEGLWNATYDPQSRDIKGAYGTPVFRPYTMFARLRRPVGRARVDVLVGSYQLNYGEGLVINTLGGRKRTGHSISNQMSIERSGNRRFREWDGLLGAVGRVVAPLTGGAELDVSVFGSLRNHDQYIGFVKVAGGQVFDPTAGNGLESPRVWSDGQRLAYQTVPNLFRVGVFGGNATFRINKRTHLGVTGYAGLIDRTIMAGVEDPNEILLKRRWPVSKNFGSIGLNGRIGFGLLEVSGEYALSVGDDVGQALILFVELEPAWGTFTFTARHYDLKYGNPFAKAQATPSLFGGLRTRGEQGIRLAAKIEPVKWIGARMRFDLNRNLVRNTWDFDMVGTLRGRPLEWLQVEVQTAFKNQNLAVNGRQQFYGGTLTVDDLIAYNLLEDTDESSLFLSGERFKISGGLRADHKKIGSINARYTRIWSDNGKTYQAGNSDVCSVDMLQGHQVRIWGNVKPTKTTSVKGSFTIRDTDVAGNRAGPTSGGANLGNHGFSSYVGVNQKIVDTITLQLRGGLGRRLPNRPSPCDFEANDVYVEPVIYEPDKYDLRWFGDFFVKMVVKF